MHRWVTDDGDLMSYQRKIYQGSNGESWWLCRDQSDRVFILHETNGQSGAQTARIEIGEFFTTANPGPEQRSLLIGGLAELTAE
jgi:hypothetical protein